MNQVVEMNEMHLVPIGNVTAPKSQADRPFRHFLEACGTFASNVVERFHEYADARLAEELTIAEQRRRLLEPKVEQPAGGQRARLAHQSAHPD